MNHKDQKHLELFDYYNVLTSSELSLLQNVSKVRNPQGYLALKIHQ